MKIKTQNLTDPALDWAVATLEKLPKDLLVVVDGRPIVHRTYLGEITELRCEFSAHWSQGGPIIERECMEFDYDEESQVYTAANGVHAAQGKTHLIAAMRCYVASKLGSEIDVPDELV